MNYYKPERGFYIDGNLIYTLKQREDKGKPVFVNDVEIRMEARHLSLTAQHEILDTIAQALNRKYSITACIP